MRIFIHVNKIGENIGKVIRKTIPPSEYRDALLGYKYEPHKVKCIQQLLGTTNYRLTLELENATQK